MAIKKDQISVDEFDELTDEEQTEVLEEIRNKLGNEIINMRMFTTTDIKKWWGDLGTAGRLAFEMLLSNFFLDCIRVAVSEGPESFAEKTALSHLIMTKQLQYRDGKVIIGDQGYTEHTHCDNDCNPCTCDECNDFNGGEDDGKGDKTYH